MHRVFDLKKLYSSKILSRLRVRDFRESESIQYSSSGRPNKAVSHVSAEKDRSSGFALKKAAQILGVRSISEIVPIFFASKNNSTLY